MKSPSSIVIQFFEDYSIAADSGFLIACSGGVDSMVLTELMRTAGVNPTLAHCNFKLRGADANADQDFVRNYANKHNLPFHTADFTTEAYSQKHGISIQMAARDLRYAFFEKIMEQYNLNYLLTAHHADDNLETILLNLGRGTGLPGLSGIAPSRNHILRPMLTLTKAEIVELAKEMNLKWREDASNKKEDYQRNYIRHKVAPVFKDNFPGFDKRFKNTQNQLQQDAHLFNHLLKSSLKNLEIKEGEVRKIKIADLLEIPGYLSLLHHWLQPYGIFDLIAIRNSMGGESGRIFAGTTHDLLVDRAYLILQERQNLDDKTFQLHEADFIINTPFGLELEQMSSSGFSIPRERNVAALDKDKLQFPLQLRRWQHGDSFVPIGMKGQKKVSDFLIDAKVNRFEKENTWVLLSENEIVWVVNHRIDDRYKISNTTKTVYFARLI